jgi:hypothetical protein
MASISTFEDLPQLVLSGVYMRAMLGEGIEPDLVAKISMGASLTSIIFNVGSIL